MRPKVNTIVLNGKRYDAKTGKLLGDLPRRVQEITKSQSSANNQKQGNIDGFTRRPVKSKNTETKKQPVTTLNTTRRKTEKSKTLMRAAVKKPSLASKKDTTPTIKKHNPSLRVVSDHKLMSRASAIKKSPKITKFASVASSQRNTYTLDVLPVKKAPAESPALPKNKLLSKPHNVIDRTHARKKIIDDALRDANSHKQPKVKKPTRRQRISKRLRISNRVMNFTVASLALLLLGGFIAYQNIANLSMRVAATRAGIDGTLPSYKPSGFGIAGPIQYERGKITVNFASRSDQRHFRINQMATQWNSEALLDNFLASGQKIYQTYQSNGKTIYVYDENNATWVDGGIWYQIEGNSSINNDQLIRMAISM